ncbi:hypothetical protein EMIT0232MI5_210038 [Pseudomonas sp. IT-232MI5]
MAFKCVTHSRFSSILNAQGETNKFFNVVAKLAKTNHKLLLN